MAEMTMHSSWAMTLQRTSITWPTSDFDRSASPTFPARSHAPRTDQFDATRAR